jgi:hypothetical protein
MAADATTDFESLFTEKTQLIAVFRHQYEICLVLPLLDCDLERGLMLFRWYQLRKKHSR